MQCEYMRHNVGESRPIFTFAMGEDDQRPMERSAERPRLDPEGAECLWPRALHPQTNTLERSAERSVSIPRGQSVYGRVCCSACEHHTDFLFGYHDKRYFG
jgi:hypothetical protein